MIPLVQCQEVKGYINLTELMKRSQGGGVQSWSGRDPNLLLTSTSGLARLSFWMLPAQIVEFKTMYEARLGPTLKQHDLSESAHQER